MRTRLIPVLSVLLALTCASASGTTLNFSSLSQPGNSYAFVAGSYTQDGFMITSSDSSLYVWEASSPNLPSLSAADTSLFEFFAFSTVTLSRGGSAFSLQSIDLAPLITGASSSFLVTFTGTRADMSIVSQTFSVNDSTPPLLQTFMFSNFTDLVALSFTQGTNIGFFGQQDTAYQFDNVVVSTVPEPNTLSLIGLVFAVVAGLTLTRR